MKSSPDHRLGRQPAARLVLLPSLLTFALSLLLTACAGLSSSSQPRPTTATEKVTLSFSPATINFGTVQLNKVVSSTFSLTNVGPSPETIESATIVPSPTFSLHGWTGAVTLKPGQEVQLQATFTPTIAGNYSGTILVTMSGEPVEYLSSSETHGNSWPVPGRISIPVTATASAENGLPPVVGISVSPTSLAVQSGQSKQFTSTVTGTSNVAVTWTAVIGSITSSGLYTAPTVTSQTSDTISAISVADSTKSASASVTVTPAAAVVGVSLSPTSLALQSGQSKQFTSTVTGTSNMAVTWTAVLGSITSSGLYTAPTITSQTSDTISAISVADPSKYDSGSVTLTPAPSSGAAYSLNANSVTTKHLPDDIMNHCYGNTSNCSAGDAIAKCAMTDCGAISELGSPTSMGLFQRESPGNNDPGTPVYYSTGADPYYKLVSTAGPGVAWPTGQAETNVIFRAPNAATFSESTVETQLAIWDQSTGWVVHMYGGLSSPGTPPITLPAASGCGTLGNPCLIPTSLTFYNSAATNLFTSPDYNYGPNSAGSPGNAPIGAMVREQELMNGLIPHAFMVTVDCVKAPNPYVFPANAFPGKCGTGSHGVDNANRPSAGNLLFLDYTPAQIAVLCGGPCPAWQTTLVTAASAGGGYGFYISESSNAGIGIYLHGNENIESAEAWKYYNPGVGCINTAPFTCYNDPFWPWIETQKGLDGSGTINNVGCQGASGGTNPSMIQCNGGFLANIPRTIGPEGSDSEGNSCTTGLGCYPTGHIHVADSCIAKGYAGVSGGCL
jgi:hypothetical protein